ncbi:hypothetical protein IG197_34385 (plasmid) [Aminobacter sp. SR38]|jgi:hypothetical protein|nr:MULTISPECIES: hypothetical protein [unclassified Aminobacter]QOF75466.1 hypothetical protein IG197_34385 [Aminobacter sp. SR38]
MNFISVMAPTEEVAREQASTKTGYDPDTIGRMSHIFEQGNNSRQNTFIFETDNDVTKHPLYAKATLAQVYDLTGTAMNDGPVLRFGPEVTVGG